MARYKANAHFQTDYYKRRKQEGPLGTTIKSVYCFPYKVNILLHGYVERSKNKASILYTFYKKLYFVIKKQGCSKLF